MNRSGAWIAGALALALGIAVAGALAGSGFARARQADRYVTVKGISEREVRADTGLWPLRLVAADDDLSRANQQIAGSVEKLRAFLAANGISEEETSLQGSRSLTRSPTSIGRRVRWPGETWPRRRCSCAVETRSGSSP